MLLVYRDARQYVRYITSAGVIVWTHNPQAALPMTCAQAMAPSGVT